MAKKIDDKLVQSLARKVKRQSSATALAKELANACLGIAPKAPAKEKAAPKKRTAAKKTVSKATSKRKSASKKKNK